MNHDITSHHTTPPERTADFVDLTQLNDWLTTTLEHAGWISDTDSDAEDLNDLTHRLAHHIDVELTAFLHDTVTRQ